MKINLKSVMFYAAYAAVLVFLNKAAQGAPLSFGLCFAMLICGANALVAPALLALSSAVNLNLWLSLCYLFAAAFMSAVTLIYRKTGRKIKYEGIVYLLISFAPYIAFAPCRLNFDFINITNEYIIKGIAAGVSMIFAYFCLKSVYAAVYRLCRCRLREDELISIALLFAISGIGLLNLCNAPFYTCVAAAIIVFSVRLFRSPAAIIVSLVVSVPPAAINLNATPIAAYVAVCTVTLLFCNLPRFAPPLVAGALSAGYMYVNGDFNTNLTFVVLHSVALCVLVAIPAIAPDANYKLLYNKLSLKENLPNTAVERCKRQTSEKLFRISEVFREIECAFGSLDANVNEAGVRRHMVAELKNKICTRCERAERCKNSSVYLGFKKLVDSGCAKGKVNLIDLPSEVTVNCSKPSEIIKDVNILLGEYRRFMLEAENARSGRALLAEQAKGVAEVMKSCAVDLSRRHAPFGESHKTIIKKLSSMGISCPEIYISDDDCPEISAVISGNADYKLAAKVISDVAGRKYILKDKINFGAELNCLIFTAPPKFDAAFGMAYAVKSGEQVSGDTHSVIRINERAFLMALSDGMGSGEYAQKVSSTAISLIEAFYRAEMPERTVLNTINKLLAFNRDERFACIDIAAINLDSGSANFVKIGSPAGIIMREGEIKVLESQSLPLGILDNLKPTVCTESLSSGDIVVFMSDGITSSFSSAPELYEFLQTLSPLNPQNLADNILNEAILKNNGAVLDDMTVLCTRIFTTADK